MNRLKQAISSILIIAVAVMIFPITAHADTDGSEIQITDQPERLILQLGPQWAGVEFELKTDAGVFPIPVVVDASGILQMDLGGSKSYILSCLASPVNAPPPQPETEPPEAPELDAEPDTAHEDTPEPEANSTGIPVVQLVVFLIGIAGAGGGLYAIRYFKRRRESHDHEDYDDDYD